MTVYLPEDLRSSVRQEVSRGRFATADDAVAEIVRAYFRDHPERAGATPESMVDPLLGAWHDATDEVDGIVSNAMRRRREKPWRVIDGE
jgi:Arc/MetJ-type ribon-helix-helix transcriptional regulator